MAEAADPIGCARVLDEELRHLRDRSQARPDTTPPALDVTLRQAHAQHLSALCLSGGGIRSASFALGVLEGLCRRGLIGSFDYLSTVSGGGYTGSWLSAWRYHAASTNTPVAWPQTPPEPGGPAEPEPLIRVRLYTRYLAPHTGLFSVDLWTLLATVGRNLLLMWLVLLPILGALLTLPYIYFAIVRAADREEVTSQVFTLEESSTWLLLACGALFALALGFIVRDLPSLGGRRSTQRQFLTWCLAPLCLGALGLTLFWSADTVELTFGRSIAAAAIGLPLIWAVAGLRTSRRWRPRTWIASSIAGAVAAGALSTIATGSFGFGHELEYDYATLGFPFVLGVIALATVVQIGLSREETSDDDLEWWSRFGGWLLIVLVCWLAASVVVLVLPQLFRWMAREVVGLVDLPGITLSGALGVLTSVVGGLTALATRSAPGESSNPGPIRRVIASLAAPIFVVLLLAFVAAANLELISLIHHGHLDVGVSLDEVVERAYLVESVVLLAALLGVGLLMAVFVPVNKYLTPRDVSQPSDPHVPRRFTFDGRAQPERLHRIRSRRRHPDGVVGVAAQAAACRQCHAQHGVGPAPCHAAAQVRIVHDQSAAFRELDAGIPTERRVRMPGDVRGHYGGFTRHRDDDFGGRRKPEHGCPLNTRPHVSADAVQCAPGCMARQSRARRRIDLA